MASDPAADSREPRELARMLVPVVVAVAVAGAVAVALAVHQARSNDELFTFGEVNHDHLAAVWHTYRSARDATPPASDLVFWAWGRVFGTGRIMLRGPSVIGWVVAAACGTWFLRRAHPLAAVIGGLVPTASALVGLGAATRPYGLLVGAVGVALVAWQRTLEHPERRRPKIVLAVALGVAVALHYAAFAVVLAFAIAEADALHRSPGRVKATMAAILSGGLVAVAAAIPVLGHEVDVQRSGSITSFSLVRLPAFYASTARPAAALVVVLAVGLAFTWSSRPRPSSTAIAGPLRPSELVLGIALLVVVPVFAVVAMRVASGYYAHRYAAPALLGGGILVGAAADMVVRRSRVLAALVTVAALGSIVVAPWRATSETISNQRAEQIIHQLSVPTDGLRVVFLDDYLFLVGGESLPGNAIRGWRIDRPAVYPGTAGAAVDLERALGRAPTGLWVVGDEDDIRAATPEGWTVRIVGRSHLDYDQLHLPVVSALLSRR